MGYEGANSSTFQGQLQVTMDHLDALARDHKHFTARWLTLIKTKLGLDINEAIIAKVIVAAFCIWLAFAEEGCFAVNVVLTITPLLLSLFYPDERAASEDMLAYWSCYALLTLFDFALAVIPIWSILKLAVFSLFFLRPWRLATRIRVLMLLREVRRSRTMEKGHSRRASPSPEPKKMDESHYVNLRPHSKTELTNPSQSVYANTGRPSGSTGRRSGSVKSKA
uniref:Receptor expression-enhancing protein n=1 Tax=Meloidogyne incognita TaxID=6306 RepID=A0A914MBT8_MELIC